MATTDSRTGFRLPWSTDRAASREASAEPADEIVAAVTELDDEAVMASTPEPGDTRDQEAPGDADRGQEEELVTILAPDVAQHPGAGISPTSEHAAPVDADAAPGPTAPAEATTHGPAPVLPAAPTRRPTKFLADLTRAMQTAAEQARAATLDQYRAEGTTVIEQIHARSATGATELRRRADDDVSAIKDWSKAEIARIREETERRIAARREQLEGQLERHAAIIEHEIEKVRGRVSTFEGEMGSFFDDLLGEEDPAVFAARAASLPEPPSFEDLDDDAIGALLQEPGVGVPEPEAAVAVAVEPEPEPVVEMTAETQVETEPVVAAAEVVGAVEAEVVGEVAANPGTEVATEATFDAAVDAPAVEESALDREAAMAAIQAAAEAAASLEAAEADDRAEAVAAFEAAPEPGPDTIEQPEPAVAELVTETAAQVPADDAAAEAPATVEAPAAPEPEIDPRLAMLGLTPDFAAAEMAAAEAAAAEVDDVPEIGGDALEARLAGLVPSDAPAPAAASVTTQVVVTGLVSVASIASFKRHIGRLAGVAHVGVSSGPDGEFVFAVQHDPEASLRDLLPTLPGFGARVVGAEDGIVRVSAQDLQD